MSDRKKWTRTKSTIACPNGHGPMHLLTDGDGYFCGDCQVIARLRFE